MATHPLTPMKDSDIVRLLTPQTPRPVGNLWWDTLQGGVDAARRELDALSDRGIELVVADAVTEADLEIVAAASRHLRVVSGSAGLAGAIGRLHHAETAPTSARDSLTHDGPAIVLAGSCSTQTLRQVALATQTMPSLRLDPAAGGRDDLLAQARRFVDAHRDDPRLMVYTSASADERAAAAARGVHVNGSMLEQVLALTAQYAVTSGRHRVVVAGGETSGAVVRELGVRVVTIGEEAARGVPWCAPTDQPGLSLLLKSGNFGDDTLLVEASR